MKYKHSICWVRRDLRLSDHVAMSEATSQSDHVTVVFVFDTTILSPLKDKDDKRITFIHESLRELDKELVRAGSRLIVRHGDPKIIIPDLAKTLQVEAVFTNRDYEPRAKDRDTVVEKKLSAYRIPFHSFKDQVIFEGKEIKTGSGDPYRVFTPYKNTWLSLLRPSYYEERAVDFKRFTPREKLRKETNNWSLEAIGFRRSSLWLEAGPTAAKRRLQNFRATLSEYHRRRNFPADVNGTSGLSVHLRFGTISVRTLVRFAKTYSSEGSHVWLSEVIWRDFYQMILDQFPYVVHGAFRKDYDTIKWPGKDEHFEAWKEGKTGYPIIDAAMRHFKDTGWMHNRLRMIVASFLTKDLLVDWKKGEAWFAQKLLDFDLAANNGGWQWSASTGCDAQPYFRIFNPVSQSEKFDPEGAFIRQYVPELKKVSNKEIHWPHSPDLFSGGMASYIAPIVDHGVQRLKALALFKRI